LIEVLSILPRPVVAVFSQMLDHQANVVEIPEARIGTPEPKTLRIFLNQSRRAIRHLRRGWTGHAIFDQRALCHNCLLPTILSHEMRALITLIGMRGSRRKNTIDNTARK
jgi:hypothetical protein